jgi:hypothetical protein
MMALFNPHANDYGDLSKLPAAEVISKHLSPIVYSQSSDENGYLIESTGPVTFTDLLLGLGAGVGFAARSQLQALQPQVPAFAPGAPATPSPSQPDTAPTPPPQTAPATP